MPVAFVTAREKFMNADAPTFLKGIVIVTEINSMPLAFVEGPVPRISTTMEPVTTAKFRGAQTLRPRTTIQKPRKTMDLAFIWDAQTPLLPILTTPLTPTMVHAPIQVAQILPHGITMPQQTWTTAHVRPMPVELRANWSK